MEQHETVDCEEILAVCEFKDIGCGHTEVMIDINFLTGALTQFNN